MPTHACLIPTMNSQAAVLNAPVRGSQYPRLMKERCYLCSQPATTRDHIPPVGFFPPPRPSNLITVPCCQRCNVAYSVDDDYFRLVLSSLIGRSPAGDRIWEEKSLTNSVPRLRREVDAILASTKDVVIPTDHGPMEATSFELDTPRFERYVVRLTKGLLAHHYPGYVYSDATFSVRFVPPTGEYLDFLAPYRDLLKFDERGDRVFRYRHGLTDTAKSGVWLLTFYDAALISVHHARPDAVLAP